MNYMNYAYPIPTSRTERLSPDFCFLPLPLALRVIPFKLTSVRVKSSRLTSIG